MTIKQRFRHLQIKAVPTIVQIKVTAKKLDRNILFIKAILLLTVVGTMAALIS